MLIPYSMKLLTTPLGLFYSLKQHIVFKDSKRLSTPF